MSFLLTLWTTTRSCSMPSTLSPPQKGNFAPIRDSLRFASTKKVEFADDSLLNLSLEQIFVAGLNQLYSVTVIMAKAFITITPVRLFRCGFIMETLTFGHLL